MGAIRFGTPILETVTATVGVPARTAAFFDLDKTVIAKSSTLAFSKPFFNQGLLNRRAVLKSSYAQFLFLMSGADHDQMDRMRSYVTAMCTSWDVEQIKSIVNETLHDIVDPLVFAEARELIADHRLCGRDVVVVSASGEEIVARRSPGHSERHTRWPPGWWSRTAGTAGEIGFYCFGEGKAAAIRELAVLEGYPLEHCYAYSDSVTPICRCSKRSAIPVRSTRIGGCAKEGGRAWLAGAELLPTCSTARTDFPAPSGAAVATTVALGLSALASGTLTYSVTSSLLRRLDS